MRKVLIGLMCAATASGIAVSAQTISSNDPAALKIVRIDLQRTAIKGPSVRAVASTYPTDQAQAASDRHQDSDSDRDPALHRMSQNAEVAPKTTSIDSSGNPRASRNDPAGNVPAGYSVVYIASIVVKNVGRKTVTSVDWEYMLFAKDATDPLKRYKVHSKKIIPPGEQAELTKEITPRGQEQQARLMRIEYADGTFWQAPGENKK
jgi:hypothetical protein